MDETFSRLEIEELCKRFENCGAWSVYSEQDTATKWLKPLLSSLGWDISDQNQVREQVLLNKRSNKQKTTNFLDCVLYLKADYPEIQPHIVFEFKALASGNLKNKKAQIRKLKDNAKQVHARYAVFSRFFETIIYDVGTGKEEAYFRGTDDYLKNFDALWRYLANPGTAR